MQMLVRCATLAALLAAAGPAAAALPEGARTFLLHINVDPIRSQGRIRLAPVPAPAEAPRTTSILVYEANGPGASCWHLPLWRWGSSRPSSAVYNDRHLIFSPVRRAKWRRGELTLVLSANNPRQPLGYPLVQTAKGTVVLVLTNVTAAGEERSCFVLGPDNGTVLTDTGGQTATFRAVDVHAPAACPDEPIACP